MKPNKENVAEILSSLWSRIAVLDGDGNVVVANPDWDGFATQEAGVVERRGVGSSCFRGCQTAIGNAENFEV